MMTCNAGRRLRAGAIGLAFAMGWSALAPARADDDTTYRTATGLLHRGLHEAAAEEYRKFLREEPDDARVVAARYGLAVCLARLARASEAAAELDRVLEDKGFELRADALLLRARCHLEAGEHEAAAARLRELRERHADSPRLAAAAGLEGEALYRAGRPGEAAPLLQAAFDGAPDEASKVRAGYFLAMTELDGGGAERAARRLAGLAELGAGDGWPARLWLAEGQARQAMQDGDGAARLYRKASAGEDPQVRRAALLGLGRVLRQAGDLEGAAEALRPLLDDEKAEESIAARIEQARCWLDAGQPARAAELLKQASAAGGESAYWLARAEADCGDHAAAARRLRAALEEEGDSPLAANMLYDLAVSLSKSGEPGRAIEVLGTFSDRFPGHALGPDAELALASLLHAESRYAESEVICKRHLNDASRARAATALLLSAENAYLTADYAAAERGYSKFIRAYGDDSRAWRARVRHGLALIQLERGDEARPELEAALSDPKSGDENTLASAASISLGDLAFSREDWQGAERWYVRARPGDSRETAGALLRLGLSLHRQARPAEALAVYERIAAIKDVEKEIGLHATFERGQALADLGRAAEARAAFEAVIEAERGLDRPQLTSPSLRRLASIAASEGREDDAAELLGRIAGGDGAVESAIDRAALLLAAGRPAESESVLREFLREHPEHALAARARLYLGMSLARQDRGEEALEWLGAEGGAEGIEESLKHSAMYEKAWSLRSLRRADEAAGVYRELLNAGPSPALAAHAALDLAQLDAEAGRCEEALRGLDLAEEASAGASEGDRARLAGAVAYLRGACAFRLGRWDDAAARLGAFADSSPGDPAWASAQLLAGESLLKAGRAGEATPRLKSAAQSRDAAVKAPALLRLGESLAREERWLESEEALLGYLREFASDELWFQARFGVGWAREQQGKHAGAIEAYRDVTARHDGPTAARAQFQIGECLFAQKRLDEAVTELLKVDILFAYPEWSSAALYEAGRCLQEAGKTDDAKRQYTAVIERFAESDWAGPARDRLRAMQPESLPGRAKTETAGQTQTRRTGR